MLSSTITTKLMHTTVTVRKFLLQKILLRLVAGVKNLCILLYIALFLFWFNDWQFDRIHTLLSLVVSFLRLLFNLIIAKIRLSLNTFSRNISVENWFHYEHFLGTYSPSVNVRV